MPKTTTSAAEVTQVFKQGFWLLLSDEELLVLFEQFPWFRQANVEQLSAVEWPTADHLYWPLLDVDLSVQSLRRLDDFPLMSRQL
jgi:hypothetical protein